MFLLFADKKNLLFKGYFHLSMWGSIVVVVQSIGEEKKNSVLVFADAGDSHYFSFVLFFVLFDCLCQLFSFCFVFLRII